MNVRVNQSPAYNLLPDSPCKGVSCEYARSPGHAQVLVWLLVENVVAAITQKNIIPCRITYEKDRYLR